MWDYFFEFMRKSLDFKIERMCVIFIQSVGTYELYRNGEDQLGIRYDVKVFEKQEEMIFDFLRFFRGIEVKVILGGFQNYLIFFISDGLNKKKLGKVRVIVKFYFINLLNIFI